MIETVDGLFLDAVRRFPRRAFLHHLGEAAETRRSYLEEARRLAGLVGWLDALGLQPGDRLLAYADDALVTLELTLACAHAGVVLLPLSPVFSPTAARRLVDRTQARVAVTTPEHAAALSAAGLTLAIAGATGATWHGVRARFEGDGPAADEALDRLSRAAHGHGPHDTYVLLPTSGTTGEPKLPVRTHAAQARRGALGAAHVGLDAEDGARLLLVAALTHSFAHTVLAIGLAGAATFVAPRALDTAASLDDVRRLDPTHVFATPRVLRALDAQRRAKPDAPRLFGPSAQVLRLAGAIPDERLLRTVADEGVDVGESYGSSECGAVALTPRGGWRPGRIGTLLPGVEARLADDGELLLRVQGEPPVYFGDPEATRTATDADGFYLTGDVAELGRDGYLRLLGRKRDVFNTSEGSNVHPQRIEELLEGLPWVRQAVLVGDQRPFFAALLVPHDEWLAGAPADALGRLDPVVAAEPHARAQVDLARLNAQLEAVERVRRFALLPRPFAPAHYAPVQAGKARRARRDIDAAYASLIAALYAPDAPVGACVPA